MVKVSFRCPTCMAPIGGDGSDENAVWVCVGCQSQYVVRDGIHYLMRLDGSWEAVHKEAVGTVECLKADGSYKEDPQDYVNDYPFFEKRDRSIDVNRVMFEMCLELVAFLSSQTYYSFQTSTHPARSFHQTDK